MASIDATTRRQKQPDLVECHGKHRFKSAERAQQIGRESRRRNRRSNLAAYRCHHCDGWHLGRSIAPRRVRERGRSFYPLKEDHSMIVTKQSIREAFEKACATNDEFDAIEHVSRNTGLAPEVIAEIVAAPIEAAAA